MIKLSVFYPNEEGKNFDMEYYCNEHMPMVQKKLGTLCKNVAVDQGMGGTVPGSPALYAAIGHIYFESMEDLQTAFSLHTEPIMKDIPNFTDIEPIMQISEVKR